jgi:RNA-directed DNA polymerase
MMYGREKSDPLIGAVKSANNPANGGAESMERRKGADGNTGHQRTRRTQCRVSVSQRMDRVRRVARERKKEKLTSLLHHLDIEMLHTSFYWLKRNAAVGEDGVSWAEYEENLETNLVDLLSAGTSKGNGCGHLSGNTRACRNLGHPPSFV